MSMTELRQAEKGIEVAEQYLRNLIKKNFPVGRKVEIEKTGRQTKPQIGMIIRYDSLHYLDIATSMRTLKARSIHWSKIIKVLPEVKPIKKTNKRK